MKSVGEAMSIGRTFRESMQKGVRSLEIGRYGLGFDGRDARVDVPENDAELTHKLVVPNDKRHFYIRLALEQGRSAEEVARLTHIDPWFIENIAEVIEMSAEVAAFRGKRGIRQIPKDLWWRIKGCGFSDVQIATLTGTDELTVYNVRTKLGVKPAYKLVDTCAGEFNADRPYFYSTYEKINENRVTDRRKVIILGGGPNRIGQGIEFDYCCCHASYAVKELGYEAIIINSNPETVSTDYDTSDKLYFEPLTREDVLAIVEEEKPEGVIVQLGGQTPLNLAGALEAAGVKILGTSTDSIDRAEDRERFKQLIHKLDLTQTPNATARSFDAARRIAADIGYPVMVRPSYVLGGRAMETVYDEEELERFMAEATLASDALSEHPILIDKFLEHAIEVDVDAVADGKQCVIGGIMEHIEEAGIHSGDSACVMPPITLTEQVVARLAEQTKAGEVMGIDTTFGLAFAKAQLGAGHVLPLEGKVFVSVRDGDKRDIIFIAKRLVDMGFELVATAGTAAALAHNDVPVLVLRRISVGRPNVVDLIKNKQIKLIINTVSGKHPRQDEITIRNEAIANAIPLISTVSAAAAVVNGIEALKKRGIAVRSLQEFGRR